MSISGADISGWQPANVDLTGLSFVYVKSTQGTYKVNANHDAQVSQARSAGLVVGHYHFPAWGDPVAEAHAFVGANGALPGEFLVLDIEDSPQTPWPANPVPWCCAFVDEVQRLTGIRCMDYCGPNVRHTWDWTALAQRGGGLISPEYNNVGPSDPSPWAGTAMWQNANTNISGGDSDVFFGDRNALLAYGTPAGVTLDAGTITPITTDWFDMASLDDLVNVLKRQDVADAIAARVPYAWFTNKYGRPVQFESLLGQLDLNVNNNHAALTAQVNGVPAAVWNQNIGTGNAAGVVNHIDAKPVAATAAVAQVDVEALAAKLATTLPPAVVAQLAAQLAKL